MNGDGLQGRNYDQIQILERNGADQNLISDHEGSAEGVALAE
jgi:hypothetical protein